VLRSQAVAALPGVTVLGLYGVLGQFDFVDIVEAPDNEAVARFSLEMGVRAGVHITTLPAIPISRLEGASDTGLFDTELGEAVTLPEEYRTVEDADA